MPTTRVQCPVYAARSVYRADIYTITLILMYNQVYNGNPLNGRVVILTTRAMVRARDPVGGVPIV